MSSNHNQVIGSRLKELRLERGLKISEMAESLYISRAYVGLLEKGTKKASSKVLEKYADFF
ncbi:helix-turn-helix domain-containing protein [Ureibacillus aquaedulcis]|uniref:Helix-turn-helix transcriptional regulator n=1 Tax=Ureibacillus aquaedulcis TaxID=3058421 RepID=A0ABT8GW07_9BACL|nr:helix-turn-helix transcriptional regulator [Ureibacillus sp. BA0131]MDN4495541.1 helix-turn-helix transcriptional regulator [Ureibacillus sp. BA0131]